MHVKEDVELVRSHPAEKKSPGGIPIGLEQWRQQEREKINGALS